jgi:phosphoribosylformylglycinamidine cyclo-ligase
VSSTDGVGTKVKLAADFNRLSGVGQDLVAMCVNDLVCVGAEPLFFLDYYACGKLNLDNAQKFLKGVRDACHTSGCALIGGETAEMPGVYNKEDFDCAGFAVGVVDEPETLGAHRVRAGQKLIAVESSGFHSNGYSLLRKVFEQDMPAWIDELMKPTHLYAPLMKALKKMDIGLAAVANITGGGMHNIPRVIPDGTGLQLLPWRLPPAFLEVKKRAGLDWPGILETLNCGVGLVLIVPADKVKSTLSAVHANGYKAFELGSVVNNAEKTWTLDFNKMSEVNA